MAVPFTMPDDHNEAEVLIHEIQSLLSRLQDALRRCQESSPQTSGNLQSSIAPRVRHPASSSRRSSQEEEESPSTVNSDLFNNLAWLAAISQDSFNTSALTTSPIDRSPSRRLTSQSSFCDESKISVTAIVNPAFLQDWTQNDGSGDPSQSKTCASDSLLSRLVPDTFTGSLWTAMICFVGWHLFRGR